MQPFPYTIAMCGIYTYIPYFAVLMSMKCILFLNNRIKEIHAVKIVNRNVESIYIA